MLTLGLLLTICFTPRAPRALPSGVSSLPGTAPVRQLPISFEANQGQTDSQVRFLAHEPGYTLFLTPQEALLALDAGKPVPAAWSGPFSPDIAASSVLTAAAAPALVGMRFLQANAHPQISGQDPLPGIVNYFLGDNPTQWHTNIPTYAQVRYQNIYPGIDLLYDGSRGSLEYDFLVAPGGDPSLIHLGFSGVQGLSLDARGDLVLHLPGGTLPEAAPQVYQVINGRRQPVDSRYSVQGATKIGFALGAYDASQPLVIDPAVIFATYLGGAQNDDSTGLAMDSAGNAYVTGATSSTSFPTQNPLQASPGGGASDAFVTKVNAAGTALVYSTYLGGSLSDWGTGIAVDSAGNAYVTGATSSTNFPTQNPLQASPGGGASDAFVTELNAAGTGLVYSTYLGGNGMDWGASIAVDSAGNAYVTGSTRSTSFPTQSALQAAFGGGTSDAFVTKVNAGGTALGYSTYLGGSGADWGAGIAVDSAGNAYITGGVSSPNFPLQNALQTTLRGTANAFVSKLNAAGTALVYSTYLGGSTYDAASAIALDSAGDAYLTGVTHSSNFPTQGALYATYGGGGDAFVTKVSAAGTALVYSTYLGGSRSDWGTGIAVDSAGNAYITGSTRSTNFPTHNPLYSTSRGGVDAFVSEILARGNALASSSYLGGSGDDQGTGIAVASMDHIVYVAGATASSNFPTAHPIKGYGGMEEGFLLQMSLIGDPGSVTASATAVHTVTGDFTGDGIADVVSFYNYGNNQVKAWLFPGTSTGSLGPPTVIWDSGVNAWNWNALTFLAGDFTGDGRTDVMAIHDDGGGRTTFWLFAGTGTGIAAPVQVWDSGAGNFNWSRAQFVAGDFNGDRKVDIGAFYDYGSARTKAFLWPGTTASTWTLTGPVWDSGVNNWNASQAKYVAGDFTGDGKADVLAFYNYGSAHTKAFLWPGIATGLGAVSAVWDSGVGNFDWSRAQFVAGDFNGDGKADVVAFYDYGSAHTKAFLWPGTTASTWTLTGSVWDSGVNNWNTSQAKYVAGDFTGDGRADVLAFYNYGSAHTKAWLWPGTTASTWTVIGPVWDSGVNNWNWNNM
jgi:hypothetical protein